MRTHGCRPSGEPSVPSARVEAEHEPRRPRPAPERTAHGMAVTARGLYTPGFRGAFGDSDPSRSRTAARQKAQEAASHLLGPGILLGVGLGGLRGRNPAPSNLHQILQWHHMLSSEGDYPPKTVAGLETKPSRDGSFFTRRPGSSSRVGIYLLWSRTTNWRWAISGRAFVASSWLAGVSSTSSKGVVDHHLLAIHHVREGPEINETAWDLGFLAASALLLSIAGGLPALRRRGSTRRPVRRAGEKYLTRLFRQANLCEPRPGLAGQPPLRGTTDG